MSTEQPGPSVGVLRWRTYEVPRNKALLHAISQRNAAEIREKEKAYIFQLCATKNGEAINLIHGAICAHWRGDIDPKRVADHLVELVNRGIIERVFTGRYRVTEKARASAREMLRSRS